MVEYYVLMYENGKWKLFQEWGQGVKKNAWDGGGSNYDMLYELW
jgi:hypothetical protein